MAEIRWLSTKQAAKRIGLSPSRTRALAASGILPAVKAGTGRGVYRITEQAAEEYRRDRITTDPPSR